MALALLAWSVGAVDGADSVVRLCADQWMPYNGDPAAPKPGYVIELAKAIFEPAGIKVEYTVMPYDEALAAVKEGTMSGVIGANAEEGKELTLPAETIGSVPICLITRNDSNWTYNNVSSFRSAKLGVIKGYTYWPVLDSFLAKHEGPGLFVAEGDSPLEELMTKLQAGELDVVAESEPILLWFLRSHDIDRKNFRIVFKSTPDPIFVAFAYNDEGKRFAALFDEGIRALRKSGELSQILQRYGLRDWQ